MLSKEELKEKLTKGWIRTRVTFEVMATDKVATENTLREHIKKIKAVKDNEVLSEKYEETVEVKPPPRNISQAFSQVAEVEMLSKNLEVLLFIIISFAPSSLEVLAPKELTITANTIQVVMNSVADVMHRFAAQGIGGIVISGKK